MRKFCKRFMSSNFPLSTSEDQHIMDCIFEGPSTESAPFQHNFSAPVTKSLNLAATSVDEVEREHLFNFLGHEGSCSVNPSPRLEDVDEAIYFSTAGTNAEEPLTNIEHYCSSYSTVTDTLKNTSICDAQSGNLASQFDPTITTADFKTSPSMSDEITISEQMLGNCSVAPALNHPTNFQISSNTFCETEQLENYSYSPNLCNTQSNLNGIFQKSYPLSSEREGLLSDSFCGQISSFHRELDGAATEAEHPRFSYLASGRSFEEKWPKPSYDDYPGENNY